MSFTRINVQTTDQKVQIERFLLESQDKVKEYTLIKGYVEKQIQINAVYA